jgi:hypothetical protein
MYHRQRQKSYFTQEERTEIHLGRDDLPSPAIRQLDDTVQGPDEQHQRREPNGTDHEFDTRIQHTALRRRDHSAYGRRRGVIAQEVDAACGVGTESDELEDDAAEHDIAAQVLG